VRIHLHNKAEKEQVVKTNLKLTRYRKSKEFNKSAANLRTLSGKRLIWPVVKRPIQIGK